MSEKMKSFVVSKGDMMASMKSSISPTKVDNSNESIKSLSRDAFGFKK